MGLFSSKKQTIAYKYWMGIHFLLGLPIQGIRQIWYGQKCAWPVVDDPDTLASLGVTLDDIEAWSLFGGQEKGGGIGGPFSVQYGIPPQEPDEYLVEQLGSDISAFRYLTGIIFRQVYLGTSEYIKPVSFLCTRTTIKSDGNTQWYVSKADINGHMNAIHILHEILNTEEWGLGISDSGIDQTIFQAAADTCYTEDLGLSIIWDQSRSLEDFAGDILGIIDGAMYEDDETGKWVVRLARDDYDPGSLEEFDETDIESISSYSRPLPGDIASVHYVYWWDVIHDKKRLAFDYDPGLVVEQTGSPIKEEYNFPSVPDKAVAKALAVREQKQVSALLAKMTLKCKRTMSHLRPNDVIKISYPRRSITSMIVRILEINLGTLESPTVIIEAAEDVFGASYTSISSNLDTEWSDPISAPANVTIQQIVAIPFYTLSSEVYGQTGAEALGTTVDLILPLAIKPTSDHIDFDLQMRPAPSGSFSDQGEGLFCPTALLAEDIPLAGTSVVVDISNLDNEDNIIVNGYALINEELVLVTDLDTTNNQITISRAVLDSVPQAHSTGDRVWFLDGGPSIITQEFNSSDTPAVKYLTRTASGILDEGTASIFTSAALNGRQARPYLPANLKVNAVLLSENMGIGIAEELALTWVHRDRTDAVQNYELVPFDRNTSYGPESGVTYTLTIYDPTDTQLREETGLTGTSYTYTAANERSDGGLGGGDPLHEKLRFELKAVRSGIDSWKMYDVTVKRTMLGTVAATSTVSATLSFGS
jgi:hypothetical protein